MGSEKNKILVIHPTGNSNVRAVLNGLLNHNLLFRFIVSLAFKPGFIYYTLSDKFKLLDVKRRFFNEPLATYISTYPLLEIMRLISIKLKINNWVAHEKGFFCIDKVCVHLDYKASIWLSKNYKNVDAVYAYEDAALYTFKVANKNNIKRIYDLPIGYYKAARALMQLEYESNKAWAQTITGFADSPDKLLRKDNEIALADAIVVASTFTKKTLLEYYTHTVLPPIYVIPYGFPEVKKNRNYNYDGKRKLKLMFVGGLSQRKGVANVFEAVNVLKDKVELTVIGNKSVENCDILNQSLKDHNWIPSLPHSLILEQMQQHDVLLFPSLFEGFGLVISEAMSQGTPVITTDRTMGGDFIVHNTNGWLVPASDTSAIVSQLKSIIKEPVLVQLNGEAAIETAKKRPWLVYENEIANFIKSN